MIKLGEWQAHRVVTMQMLRSARLALIVMTVACGSDSSRPDVQIQPGVPLALAQHRAATISNLRYEFSLTIPAQRDESITGTATARFDLASADAPLVFDFVQPADHVLSLQRGDDPIAYEVRDEHVIVPSGVLAVGAQAITIDFVAGDGSLNRNDDYLYTLFVPDRARVALPLFDQPDLKARVTLALEVPADWQAVANGELLDHTVAGERATFTFGESDPIPTYLLAFAAGRFEVVDAERGGRTLRMLHRETDVDQVTRNLDAIFDLHATALGWLEDYTGIEYPFKKFSFVAMPAFQYGGMEHPGAIFYRARSLFLDESATQAQQLGRASLIAHETSHMWFGNLVTMEWFNDVWMKEVFANFMAAKIVNPSFPEVDHDLRFLHAHYASAYGIDRTAGANPIRQALDNLNEAGSLYGAIIYQKAPVVMKHLELLMGEEAFRDGLREYLGAHRYGNATWPDLVAVMDARTDDDLVEWSQIWVNESGRPSVTARLTVDDSGAIGQLAVAQADPADRGRLWNQRMEVALGYGDDTVRRLPVHVRDADVVVEGATGLPRPDYVLANGGGIGYGNFVLDDRSRAFLLQQLSSLPEARLRAVAMLSLYDGMLEGDVDPVSLAWVALQAAIADEDELNVQRFLNTFGSTWWGYLAPDRHLVTGLWPDVSEPAAGVAERLLWDRMGTAPQARQKAAFFNAYRTVARTPDAIDRLRDIWSGAREVEGLTLSENDMTSIAEALALRGVSDAEAILDVQLDRIDNPDRRARFEFVRPSLSADAATREAFFQSLKAPANREHEPWVLAGLRYLHHPLRAHESERHIRPSLEMLEEIQRTGDIFFPLGWLNATLGGHSTPGAASMVETFLAERPDLPPRLRGKLLQAADPLYRAARTVSRR